MNCPMSGNSQIVKSFPAGVTKTILLSRYVHLSLFQCFVAYRHRILCRWPRLSALCPTTFLPQEGQHDWSLHIAVPQHSVNIVLLVPYGINGTIPTVSPRCRYILFLLYHINYFPPPLFAYIPYLGQLVSF